MKRMTEERKANLVEILSRFRGMTDCHVSPFVAAVNIAREALAEVDACWQERDAALGQLNQMLADYQKRHNRDGMADGHHGR